MAQDETIYEAVCVKNGHDLFVLGRFDPVASDRALCKRCGTEITLGEKPSSAG